MKKYIVAMALSRATCIDRFKRVAIPLNTHAMKCIIYKQMLPDDLNHWCTEIGTWLNYANGTKCKSKLKEEDYLEYVFGEFGDEVFDAKLNLALFKEDNKKLIRTHSTEAYPDFEVTDELANELAQFYSDIVEIALPIFMSGEVLPTNQWAAKVKELIH